MPTAVQAPRPDHTVSTETVHRSPSCVDVVVASRLDEGLTSTAALVLVQVATWASGCTGACWAAIATIAAACHVSPRTAQRALRDLVARGWLLEVHEQGRTTTYRVRPERVLAPRVDPGPLFKVEPEPKGNDAVQLGLFDGGVSQCQGGGVMVTPDQTSGSDDDPTPPSPPVPGGDRTGPPPADTSDPLAVLEELLAAADAEGNPGRSSEHREQLDSELDRDRAIVEALVEPMILDLDALTPREVDQALEHYRVAPTWLVDRWTVATRGRRTASGHRREVITPDGLRRRHVVRALGVARERWIRRSSGCDR